MVAPQIGIRIGTSSSGNVLLHVHGETGVRLCNVVAAVLALLALLGLWARVRVVGAVDAGADGAVKV